MHNWLAALAQQATPDIDECVRVLGPALPLLQAFERTPQDAQWHAEGNVHIHTGMVLAELYALLQDEAKHIQGRQRQALILGTMLHDIAKPLCTREKEIRGRICVVSPRHGDVGRDYLAYRLMEFPLPYDVVETVLALVGEHSKPTKLVLTDASAGQYRAVARRVDHELLYWLERADMQGRICADADQQMERLALFRLFSEEYQAWHQSRLNQDWKNALHDALQAFDPDQQDLIYANAIREREADSMFCPEEALAKPYAHQTTFPKLVVVCGPSGAGKSTWIKTHLPHYEVVSLDHIREQLCGQRAVQKHKGKVMHAAKDQLRAHLRNHGNVVWDATNLRKAFRDSICDLGFAYKALVTLVVFQPAITALQHDNRNRTHPVPNMVLQKQIDQLEWPTVSDAHRFLVIGEQGRVLRYHGAMHSLAEDACLPAF